VHTYLQNFRNLNAILLSSYFCVLEHFPKEKPCFPTN